MIAEPTKIFCDNLANREGWAIANIADRYHNAKRDDIATLLIAVARLVFNNPIFGVENDPCPR